MKKFLLTTVALLSLAAPALADSIVVTARVDGILQVNTAPNLTGSVSLTGAIPGGIFTFNQLNVDSQMILPAGGILTSNTINLQQTNTGNHQLIIDITASGLTGTGALANLLSSFSVSGLTAGWSADEQTFINGTLLADTGVFTTPSGSAFSTNSALLSNPFTAEIKYTINSVGSGGFNGGTDIALAVPGPIVGAGLPGLFGGLGLMGAWWKRRQRNAA